MNFKKDEINVVYCCSDFYTEVCAVSIVSLFENNKHLNKINVFIIDDNITKINKDKLLELSYQYNRTISFVILPDPTKFFNDNRFTIKSLGHTFGHLILGDVIPSDIDRVISLDCDTLVLNKIDELWNWDMKNLPIAGVDDCMGRIALVKTQHLRADSIHCNSGMLLIDLDKHRKENWTKQFYTYIKKSFDNGVHLGGFDEEVMNKVLGYKMMILHPKFNLMTLEQVLTYDELLRFRQPINYYSREEIEEAKATPIVTHTTNFFYIRKRIFEENSDHPMRKQYEKYRLLTPWKNEKAMKNTTSIKNRCIKEIWHFLPRNVSLFVANFVRNEIRPLLVNKRDD